MDDEGSSSSVVATYGSSCRLSQPLPAHQATSSTDHDHNRFALLFVPPTIVDSSLEQMQIRLDPQNYVLLEGKSQLNFSERLLSMVHTILAHNLPVKAIIPIRNTHHAPADIVVLDLIHTPRAVLIDLMDQTNNEMLFSGPDAVLKLLLLHKVRFMSAGDNDTDSPSKTTLPVAASTTAVMPWAVTANEIPSCPVCLHRITPTRLGLNPPRNDQLCSKYCPPPNLTTSEPTCPRQRLLAPWPLPSLCVTCHTIRRYWNDDGANQLYCFSCAMQETLWVCLTCAYVGCGRYSNKHAQQHFEESGHPFCLELATLRIWDYVNGAFAHRLDVLECPSSPPLLHPWIPVATAHASSQRGSWLPDDEEYGTTAVPLDDFTGNSFPTILLSDQKSPKKATMIGEEYEALLQSALEEQAQHYEGQISRLRAEMTAARVDGETIPPPERREIEGLHDAIQQYRSELEFIGRDLLELQSEEAGRRATSQRLLREQQVAQELLGRLKQETAREREQGRMQVDELEQQIADLTANQRMRQQFSQHEELANAQIFGTSEVQSASKKKSSKKSRRFPWK